MVNLKALPALKVTPIVKPVVHTKMSRVIIRVNTIPTLDSTFYTAAIVLAGDPS